MSVLQTCIAPNSFPPFCALKIEQNFGTFFPISNINRGTVCHSYSRLPFYVYHSHVLKSFPCYAVSKKSNLDPGHDPEVSSSKYKTKPKDRSQQQNTGLASQNKSEVPENSFPTNIPRKPRRARRREAVAVEDFIRDSLKKTFASIQQQNPELFANKESIIKGRVGDDRDSDSSDEDDDENSDPGGRRGKKMVLEEDDPDWPLDADVGWGVRASEYFERHPIKNVVGEDGFEIDWEGEIDDNWVKEINCLEWESFAFHPSPLVVFVFERYNRASHNWKSLKELEKAIKVYWNAKDKLPPRAVKLDINIERDLAYALKVRDCPQILFLRGNRILYREKEFRTADELVQTIAYIYYNAKRPPWIDQAANCSPK